MKKETLYTIGHGRRKIDEFVGLLSENKIEKLIDVRSVPFSRFNPQYNQKALSASLLKENVEYVFMGDLLGGRPKDPSCYDEKGKPDFSKIELTAFFRAGIEALNLNHGSGKRAALMCSESDPAACHRCNLIGRVLAKQGIELFHVDQHGEIQTQDQVMKRAGGSNQQELF